MSGTPHSKMSSEDLPIRRPAPTLNVERNDQILVDEAALESFPASDAPSWTPTHAGARSREPLRTETPRELRSKLRRDVERLARAAEDPDLSAVAELVSSAFLDEGRHVVRVPVEGRPGVENLEAVLRGASDQDGLVIGAQLRSNPAATAILLGLARILEGRRFAHTVRLAGFGAGKTASHAYARRLRRQGVRLRGMLSLDSVGFHIDRHESEGLPFPLRVVASRLLAPWEGTFIAFVGDSGSRELAAAARTAFSLASRLEARTFLLPSIVPLVAASDRRSFAREGFRAALVTDTGPLRVRSVRSPGVAPGVLNYDAMADVVFGLASVIARLAGGDADV